MTRYKMPELPGPVAAHVRAKLISTDWEKLLRELRELCDSCPAQGEPDICEDCPLQGMALAAATLTLKARLVKLQAKGAAKAKRAKAPKKASVGTNWDDWETRINSGI